MTKITLLNVYGKKNIGDEAINQMALKLARQALGKSVQIYSVCVDANESSAEEKKDELKIASPYSYVINEGGTRLSVIEKVARFAEMITMSAFLTLRAKYFEGNLPKDGTYSYIACIRNSDLILNMGGGYLRTKNRFSDYFGLITTLLPIFIAKTFGKPLLFLPMSFGNFASSSQEWISFQAITNSTFYARDKITFQKIKNYPGFETAKINLKFSPDLALLNSYGTKKSETKKRKQKYVVLSARKWLPKDEQRKYEETLAETVNYLFEKYGLSTVFIPMASNSIEDDDTQVAKAIQRNLKSKKSFSISQAHSPQEVINLLDSAALGICTRMHSAILSSLVCTPFLTIEYEHKTLGFMRLLGLEKYNVHISKVNFEFLKTNLDSLLLSVANYKNTYNLLLNKKMSYGSYFSEISREIKRSLKQSQYVQEN